MKISIIVPVYNCGKYLDTCCESLLGQTYADIEVILVDDGSTDGSAEICDRYAVADNRVGVIHKPNGGVSSARNAGLRACTGEYVIFVDADDWIDRDACEQIAEQLDGKSLLYLFSGKKCTGDTVEWIKPVAKEENLAAWVADVISCPSYQYPYLRAPWAKVYKKELLTKASFPENLYIGEDACFLCDLLSSAVDINDIKVCQGNWYNYRIVTTSAVRKYKPDLLQQSEWQYQHMEHAIARGKWKGDPIIDTAMTLLCWDIYYSLKRNEVKSGQAKQDCAIWVQKMDAVLRRKHLQWKRVPKFRLLCWVTYSVLGRAVVENLMEKRLRKKE